MELLLPLAETLPLPRVAACALLDSIQFPTARSVCQVFMDKTALLASVCMVPVLLASAATVLALALLDGKELIALSPAISLYLIQQLILHRRK